MIPKFLSLMRSLFHCDEEKWQVAMNQDEMLKAVIKGDESADLEQAYTMSHLGKGLRLTGGYDDPESQFSVQHRLPGKVARSELLKSCELCCCSSSYSLTGHGKEDFSPEVPAYEGLQEYKYKNLLDRSLMELDDYQEEMHSFPFGQDKLMSLLGTLVSS